jgi:hypothetical protein
VTVFSDMHFVLTQQLPCEQIASLRREAEFHRRAR